MLFTSEDRSLLFQLLSKASGTPKSAKNMYTLRSKVSKEPKDIEQDISVSDRELLLVRDLFNQLKQTGQITADLIPTYEKFMGIVEVED